MTVQADYVPAWQTDDLADEWVDEEEEDQELEEHPAEPLATQHPTQAIHSTFNPSQGSCNFGTANFNPLDTSHEEAEAEPTTTTQVGTFVVREDLPPANLPQTPALGHKKNGMKDIFTPLQLERMFEPPSPPKSLTSPMPMPMPMPTPAQQQQQPVPLVSNPRISSRPAKPSKLSQVVVAASSSEDSDLSRSIRKPDEILETDMPDMGAFGEAKPSPSCRFTFSVPRSVPCYPARINFGTPTPNAPMSTNISPYDLQAQSTPLTSSRTKRYTEQQPNSINSRLRLFQFQYDTYTRDHLSAIVDSFGVSSPSNVSTSRNSMSHNSMGTMLFNSPEPRGEREEREEREDPETFSRLRAAKRLKLTPPSDITPESTEQRAAHHERPPTKKDYVGESKSFMEQIKRARGFSLVSASDSVEHEPVRQRAFSDSTNTLSQGQDTRSDHFIPSASSSTSTVHVNNELGSKASSKAYRRQAADLMAQLKRDRKIITEKGETSVTSQKSVEEVVIMKERSNAPSPEPRQRPKSPMKRRLDDKENQSDSDPDLDPPSYAASINHSRFPSNRGQVNNIFTKSQPQFAENLDPNRLVVMPVAIPSIVHPADRMRSPNPAFLAPPTAFGSLRFSAQIRSSSTNEDLNRLVSSGSTATTATTLTVGSAGSCVKHPGPAQMVRIAPADLPAIPDRVGGMIFDRTLGRWVKERSSSDRTLKRSSMRRSSQDSPAVTEGTAESEDPFRDIESLRESESSRSPAAQEVVGFSFGEFTNYNPDVSGGTEDMHVVDSDSDSLFEDGEDAQLSTFTFDHPPSGVIEIIEGRDDDDELSEIENGDATTDSEDVSGEGERERERSAAELEQEDEEFSNHFASFSLADEQQSQSQLDEGASTSLADAPSEAWRYGEGISTNYHPAIAATPRKAGGNRPIQPPRSALKSASVTPISRGGIGRSVSFSDGRKDGKILGLNASRERERQAAAKRAIGMISAEILQSAPSIRSKRIADMLDDLEESLLEGEESLMVAADQDPNQIDEQQQAVRAAAAANGSLSLASPRSFTRSQTIRLPGQSSPRRVNTPSRANATFLTECSFGVAHDRLVEVITDVQPFEPYWDSLNAMDLSRKKLDSVARLKEFLPKLDSLNLNNNLLSWLSGIPSTVRTLSVATNALTSLTSFGHLANIENLDISFNDIDSLQQLKCLRHLRELRADGNKITKLDGLAHFDGLLKLSLEGNQIRELDLTGFRWSRLELLNLSSNRLESLRGLDAMPALVSANLDNNILPVLDQPEDLSDRERRSSLTTTVLHKLRILRLSGNRLKHLDVARFPNLRTLYVDNNCLAEGKPGQRGQAPRKTRQRLFSLHRLCKLENFSARNQTAPGFRDSGLQLQSNDVRDVKRLYLSGNPSPIPLGTDAQACYNLVYLELAACRLTSLPSNFSALMPNIRALNLNYNFLETDDIARGLAGLTRLRKLTIVGNRMTGTKALVKMLSAMGQNIEMLDFRMNPCTLGWYLPLLVQDKDDGALLQPSEPPKGRHHSPFGLTLPSGPMATENPSNSAVGFEEARKRRDGALPSLPATGTGNSLGTGMRPTDADPTSSLKNKDKYNPSHWEALDAQFRRGLPDKAYAGRLAYRGLIMRACPLIKALDGVRITEKERRKAEALLRRVLEETEATVMVRAGEQR